MEEIKERKIKTIGLIEGVWVVILDDNSILANVQGLEISKQGVNIGSIKLDIIVPNTK